MDTISNEALRTLSERGFIQQCSDLEGLDKQMNEGPITFYVGIDPTGSSLHIGHSVPVFAAAHLARAGHRAIMLIGGGTALIGDPSGKSEMRTMISAPTISKNAKNIGKQLEFFFEQVGADTLFRNNSDWLCSLNYINFLRDIGRHFSVNRMLSFEAYRMRMERGLSFIEFNYQLLQSYDFLELYRREHCQVQIGGDDQWGNIVSGVDLIRRMEAAKSYALTFPLITRSDGKKMGKTEKDALYLDASLTSPFDFFQYLRNTPDDDVIRFLKLFTFLSMEEIGEMARWKNADINKAKERLAYEVTALMHGREVADTVLEAARAAFSKGGASSPDAGPAGARSDSRSGAPQIPGIELDSNAFASATVAGTADGNTVSAQGIGVLELFHRSGLCSSKSEARRLVQQGGAQINDKKIEDTDLMLSPADFPPQGLILRAGKKRYAKVTLKNNL